jgi:hypothetical protein
MEFMQHTQDYRANDDTTFDQFAERFDASEIGKVLRMKYANETEPNENNEECPYCSFH